MSELKTIESATAVIENVHLVYRKSEVDKVIAELKARDDVLVTDNRNLLDKVKKLENHLRENAEHFKRNEAQILENAENELRRHKHKRCLAMRNMCRYAQYSYSYLMENESCKILPNNIDFRRYNKKYHFYIRWRKRWMELAEKFKPNNSTAQQGKG